MPSKHTEKIQIIRLVLVKIIAKGIKPNGFKLSPGVNYAAYDKLKERDFIAL